MNGGFVISEEKSIATQQSVVDSFEQIKIETEKFMKENGDKLWKIYNQKIANGMTKEEAFWSTMSFL